MTALPGSRPSSPLEALARAAGISTGWTDAFGHARQVPGDTLEHLLTALGLACGTHNEIEASLAALRVPEGVPSLITADAGGEVVLRGVAPMADAAIESDRPRRLVLRAHPEGAAFAAPKEAGYHLIRVGGHALRLAVAPRAAPSVRALTGWARAFGAAVQVYGLREKADAGIGHLGAVADLAERLARHGAQALSLSPLHALFAAMPEKYSPYSPSSRVALNPLLADPAASFPPEAVAAAYQESGADRHETEALIDWPRAGRAKRAALRRLFDQIERHRAAAHSFGAFTATASAELRQHAVFEALHAAMIGKGHGGDWRHWPEPFRIPGGDEVAAFAARDAREVEFGLFLQWLTERSLAAAQARAKAAGMGIGLIADLAVGLDPAGSEAWSRPGDLLAGLSIGAPPDLLNRDGQNWGLTAASPTALAASGFSGFLTPVRAALRHAGGLRIDHILGLRRLWLIPEGAHPGEGAYLTYPLGNLLRLLAIEAHAHDALAIGEDLGTVPEDLRAAMGARGVLGMRVLFLEREADGAFTPPSGWEAQTVAMTSTHDLPTIAGWWRGCDLEWRARVREGAVDAAEQVARAQDRSAFAATTGTALREAQAAVDAAIAEVARSPSALALVPLEDLLDLPESPNLPGSGAAHPNWRRRLPAPAAELLARPRVTARLDLLRRERGAGDGAP